jgi:hypothetical protein
MNQKQCISHYTEALEESQEKLHEAFHMMHGHLRVLESSIAEFLEPTTFEAVPSQNRLKDIIKQRTNDWLKPDMDRPVLFSDQLMHAVYGKPGAEGVDSFLSEFTYKLDDTGELVVVEAVNEQSARHKATCEFMKGVETSGTDEWSTKYMAIKGRLTLKGEQDATNSNSDAGAVGEHRISGASSNRLR